jgi:hypothetical protein
MEVDPVEAGMVAATEGGEVVAADLPIGALH